MKDENLRKLHETFCENRAYFVKPLVFSAACVALYSVVPIFAYIGAASSFGTCDLQEMKLSLWIGGLSATLYKLWNWEL